MFYPPSLVDGRLHPGTHNFVEAEACKEFYHEDCLSLPEDFNPEYYEMAEGYIIVNTAKEKAYKAREKAKDDAKKVDAAEKKRIKDLINSNQDLSDEDLKKAVKLLLKG